MQDNTLKSQAFKLKGRLYTFTVLQLLQTDQSLFEKNLDEVIAKAPKMFDNTPVVLDCSLVQNDNLELQTLCQAMRTRGLLPVAVQSANAFVSTIAKTNGMAVLHASSNHDKSLIEDLAEEPQIIESAKNKMLTTPVRSGQQVVVKGGDLIIIASVSHGAELLADGNIHVYGALRGRALAGMSGDKQARIFCHSLEAELLSIAGYYRLSEAFEQQAGPCQIFLQDEHIHIEPLC